jgi:hypothetical protein
MCGSGILAARSANDEVTRHNAQVDEDLYRLLCPTPEQIQNEARAIN